MTRTRRSARQWVLNVIVPALLTLAVVAYIVPRRGEFGALGDVPVDELVLVFSLTTVGYFLNATEFGLLYRALGARIRIGENWLLYSVGQMGNYLPGQLGTVYRFRYLKVVHGMPLATSTAAYSANFVITVFATGFAGLVGALGLGVVVGTWSPPLVAALLALVLLAALAAMIRIPIGTHSSRLGRALMRLGDGWERIRVARGTAAVVLGLELARYGLAAWRLDITFGWLGTDEHYLFFLVIAPIAGLATFVAITPAGLGIRELAIAGAAVALGSTFDEGLLGSSTDRAVGIAVVLLTGLPGLVFTSRSLHLRSRDQVSASGSV